MRDTFRGGVHPRERKELSKEASLRRFDAKGEMVFPLAQHIGKPAKAIVKKGDPVLVGQIIGAADGFVSANVISSCSGTVKAVEKRRTIAGVLQECIVIDNDGKYTPGEPYGMVRDIDVGWNYARASIGLTDTHPSTPRYDITKGGNAEIGAGGNNSTTGEAATDREVIYPSDATDGYTINGGNPAEAKDRVRVRIARFAIDSMEIGLLPQNRFSSKWALP